MCSTKPIVIFLLLIGCYPAYFPIVITDPRLYMPVRYDPYFRCAFFPKPSSVLDSGHICILSRTYDLHLRDPEYHLATFLDCFAHINYKNWSMYIFNTEPRSMPGLDEVVANQPEEIRSKLHIRTIPYDHLPPYQCNPGDCGYIATDYAIYNYCPPHTTYLHITNCDNEYHPDFFSDLDPSFDLQGHYFMVDQKCCWRNTNITSMFHEECHELLETNCLPSSFKLSHVDLASVTYKYHRFIKENRKFSFFGKASGHDGRLVEAVAETWPSKMNTECFFSHSPNEWSLCRHKLQKLRINETCSPN